VDHSTKETAVADSSIPVRAAGAPGFPPAPPEVTEAGIRALVHGFYAKIRADDLLGPVFGREIADADWPRHLDNMCDFWSSAVLRTTRYGGRPLSPHLRMPDLSEAHFRRWLQLFRATAAETMEPTAGAHMVSLAERIAHSFRLAIAFHRGEDSTRVHPIAAE
jgi:hemoglobin